jgi:hypothetical protein
VSVSKSLPVRYACDFDNATKNSEQGKRLATCHALRVTRVSLQAKLAIVTQCAVCVVSRLSQCESHMRHVTHTCEK